MWLLGQSDDYYKLLSDTNQNITKITYERITELYCIILIQLKELKTCQEFITLNLYLNNEKKLHLMNQLNTHINIKSKLDEFDDDINNTDNNTQDNTEIITNNTDQINTNNNQTLENSVIINTPNQMTHELDNNIIQTLKKSLSINLDILKNNKNEEISKNYKKYLSNKSKIIKYASIISLLIALLVYFKRTKLNLLVKVLKLLKFLIIN